MVYIAEGVHGLFLSLDACTALGVLSPRFPEVAEFGDIEQGSVEVDQSVGEIHLC